ncbi:Pisatin demethylase [Madurella fahalii]|uniref:Pisatin demethylase n=1 Tax=Madurella fahalii TaxID=1157608 RepID=A0ABQ0GKB9_9PEZI
MTTISSTISPNFLTTLPIWGWVATLFILWYVTSAIATWYRLRHVPGPFLARFSYLWTAYYIARGRVWSTYINLNKYGPVVRVGPNHIVTSDPDALRRIAVARSKYVKDDWYKGARFHPEYENIGTIIDNDMHDRAKAKTTSGYSGRENGAGFEPAIDEQIARLKDLIRRKYLSVGDGELKRVELSMLMRYLTLDVITRLAYSKPFGYLDAGTDVYGFIKESDQSVKVISFFLEQPMIRPFMYSNWGLATFGPQVTAKEGIGKVMGVVRQIVSERFQNGAKHKDMIGGFIRNGMTQQEVEGEAMLQLFAGSETTANALSAALIYLSTTPHAYIRLKQEIRHAVESGHVDAEKPITFEQAQGLPYLQAVIWESLRIRNPVNQGHYKLVPPGGDTFHGIYLPAGTAIGHNTMAMTRSQAIFGKDADVYRPERFFRTPYRPGMKRGEVEMDTERIKALDIVFGGGRWMCSGKQVAMYELNKVLFELLRGFDFQPVDPKNMWDEEHYITPKYKNMWVRISDAD